MESILWNLMPKKVVEHTEVESLPYFPVLSTQKTTRVITKHFTNTMLYLPYNLTSLLTWLIYQSNVDNSLKYEDRLVARYSAAVKEAGDLYKSTAKLRLDYKAIRADFTTLIKKGYLLPTNEKSVFIINPMLSYNPKYITRKDYKSLCNIYQKIITSMKFPDIEGYANEYREVINSRITKKVKK